MNNESAARTEADRITKDEDMQFSQHSSKPHIAWSAEKRELLIRSALCLPKQICILFSNVSTEKLTE